MVLIAYVSYYASHSLIVEISMLNNSTVELRASFSNLSWMPEIYECMGMCVKSFTRSSTHTEYSHIMDTMATVCFYSHKMA